MKQVLIDCLPSPTHLFSGIAFGNKASEKYQLTPSYPRQAALESLEKMGKVVEYGSLQFIMPPIPRPHLRFLSSLGFPRFPYTKKSWEALTPWQVDARKACSSSAMWTANWAHMTPSCDTKDGKLHVSIANLASFTHRHLEVDYISSLFKQLFHKSSNIVLHPPLPSSGEFHDEGAANDIWLSNKDGTKGLTVFVWGRDTPLHPTSLYPARHTFQASQAIARRHKALHDSVFFLEQHPKALDAGVFHNDVIAFGGKNLFVCHECAYVDQKESLQRLRDIFFDRTGEVLHVVEVPEEIVHLEKAVETYFFNGELLFSFHNNSFQLLLPTNQPPGAVEYLQKRVITLSPQYIDVSESMKNGGGPACLRFQLMMPAEQASSLSSSLRLSPTLLKELISTVTALYPETLHFEELMTDRTLLTSLLKAEEAVSVLLGVETIWKKYAHRIGLKPYL